MIINYLDLIVFCIDKKNLHKMEDKLPELLSATVKELVSFFIYDFNLDEYLKKFI